MDLDGTVLDETFQPSPRTAAAIARAEAAGIACLIATGRMFVSARRDRREARRSAGRSSATRARSSPIPSAARCSCTGRSRRRWRARSCARMPEEHARRSNLYIDDELYVWEENEATRALLAGRRRRAAHRRPAGRLDRAADDEDRHRRRARGDGRAARRAAAALRQPRVHRQVAARTSSSSRRPASPRRAGWRCSPTCWASRPSRRSRSATPRTTARCSTGRAAAWRSRTRATGSRARPTP